MKTALRYGNHFKLSLTKRHGNADEVNFIYKIEIKIEIQISAAVNAHIPNAVMETSKKSDVFLFKVNLWFLVRFFRYAMTTCGI